MTFSEITATNLRYTTVVDIDSLKWDRSGAEIIYRLLLSFGAMKDVTFLWDEDLGSVRLMKKFAYQASMLPTQEDDGQRFGDQMYTLGQYIKLLIRFDRSAWKRMRNVEQKINTMHAGIEALRKQL